MGKKSKVGKQRRDKYYHLAKETGYRSRSAFKLIQLNRKFQFLQKSRVLLDLCAAPGGWLQVATKNMPVSSLIIGVDLFPIRPIPNVVTIQGDITTEKCRQSLKKELQTWKADAVIHDGAPNVGTTWVLDAFQQAQLTLVSVKLACEFLNKGGWFVTKVFRSKDYQVLLWVFNQLFKKVHATKPQASRNESAEIFVVCQGYLAPDKIDAKFFDPKYIFKEVDLDGPKKMTIFQDPSKQKKAKAIGYAEGDFLQHRVVKATEYIAGESPAEILNECSEIVIDDDKIAKNPLTTEEVKHCIKDIKVLGKKEIKLLLSWHKKLNKQKKKEEKQDQKDEKKAESSDSEDEEEKIERQLEKLKEEETAAARRKKKDLLKKRRKLRERLNKALTADTHGGPIEDGESMFELRRIKNKQQLQQVDKGDEDDAMDEAETADAAESDSDDSDLPSELDEDEAEMLREDKAKYAQVEGGDDEDDDDGGYPHSDEEEEDQNSADQNPLMVDLDDEDQEVKAKRRTNLWFSKAAFSGLGDDMDEDLEVAQMTKSYKARGGKVIENQDKSKSGKRSVRFDTSVTSVNTEGEEDVEDLPPQSDEEDSDNGLGSSEDENEARNGDEEFSDSDSDDSDSDYDDSVMLEGYAKANEIEKEEEDEDLRTVKTTKELKRKDKKSRQENKDGFEIVPAEGPAKKLQKLDPEGLAIGTLMATSKKSRRKILEHSYHRYTNGDEDRLPKWFMEDEIQHRRKQMPVTKELVADYKARLKEINARPIKKVAEAKARKKQRMNRKMEKLKKKAAAITDTVDTSDKEKMTQLKHLYKKAGVKKQQKKVTYVVSKKALAGKRMQRPRGVKGPYKVVDSRLKKDMRAKKRLEGKKKHGKRKR